MIKISEDFKVKPLLLNKLFIESASTILLLWVRALLKIELEALENVTTLFLRTQSSKNQFLMKTSKIPFLQREISKTPVRAKMRMKGLKSTNHFLCHHKSNLSVKALQENPIRKSIKCCAIQVLKPSFKPRRRLVQFFTLTSL